MSLALLRTKMMVMGQRRASLPLDGVANVSAAYSVRKLRTDYTGSCLTLRRSTDDAESDFGFLGNGDLDTTSITTWLAGGDAYVKTWYDQGGAGANASQTNTSLQPLLALSVVNGRPALRFDGADNLMDIAGDPITRTQTTHTLLYVARINDHSHNNTIFDVTEEDFYESVLARAIFLTATYKLQNQVRDDALTTNIAQYAEELAGFRLIRSTRNGNTVQTWKGGISQVSEGTNAIGAMDTGAYYSTIGAVRNGSGPANYLEGDLAEMILFSTVPDVSSLESNIATAYDLTLIAGLVRYQTTPVVAFGAGGSGYEGRILECSVIKDGATWKMWFCGIAANGGGLNQNWDVFYATSADGITWTVSGSVLDEAWEPDVIKVGETYYMAYVLDSSYNVRIASSADGITWTDHGEIIDLTDSAWSKGPNPDLGPREPCLFYDDDGTYYCYYGDQAADDDRYKVGVSVCAGDPTDPTDWVCQATPVFTPSTTAPKWNRGGDTESPCVRRYAALPHTYLMSYIGYNDLDTVTNKQWRPGFAWADDPLGPWTEIVENPVMPAGADGAFDDRIVAEASHLLFGNTFYFYYSGGKANGLNQIGLATIAVSDLVKLF